MAKEKHKFVGYSVRINGEDASTQFNTLKTAKEYVRKMDFEPDIVKSIEIVKVVTVETIMNTFVPQVVTKFVEANPSKEEFDTGINEG